MNPFERISIALALALSACGAPAAPAPAERLPEHPKVEATATSSKQAELTHALERCDPPLGEGTRRALEELAQPGAKVDPQVADALWSCFARFRVAKSKSINEVKALHDAVLAVKAPSYGDKAMAMLARGVDPDPAKAREELQFHDVTAAQVLRELRYAPAARSHVVTLVTNDMRDVAPIASAALRRMPQEAVPILASALLRTDPEIDARERQWKDSRWALALIDTLGRTGVDPARAAIVSALPSLGEPEQRAAAAQALVYFAATSDLIATFKRIYDGLPPIAGDTGLERAALLGAAWNFFEPSLAPWLLDEAARAKGTNAPSARAYALDSAVKLMRPADKTRVEAMVKTLDAQARAPVADAFAESALALDACGVRADCYVAILDEPDAAAHPRKMIKAASMAAALGNDATRSALVARVPKQTTPSVRLAMAMAILHLAPSGDEATAAALEKIGDDALAQVADMLRARAR